MSDYRSMYEITDGLPKYDPLAAKDAEIASLRGQVGRLVRLVKALETPKRRGPFGGGTDPRDTEINNASVDCRQHNDLQPPAGKESSDGA